MGIVSSGFNTYADGGDGELRRIVPERFEFSFQGRKVLQYSKATGTLLLDISPESLALFQEAYGIGDKPPENGYSLSLPYHHLESPDILMA